MKNLDKIQIINNLKVPPINKLLKNIDWRKLSNSIKLYSW